MPMRDYCKVCDRLLTSHSFTDLRYCEQNRKMSEVVEEMRESHQREIKRLTELLRKPD
jgi:hypothetical protein